MPDDTNWASTWIYHSNPNNISIIMKSTLNIGRKKMRKTASLYKDINKQFNSFENKNCQPRGTLNIFIINEKDINNSRYFEKGSSGPDKIIFGRYFKTNNSLYITPEFFRVPEYFAHELAHYFYDECGFAFGSDMAEEKQAYKFQNFYEAQ